MYFLKKIGSHFPPKEKISCFPGKKIPSFQIIQERSCPSTTPFEKTSFSEHLKKMSYFRLFFWERSSFIPRLRGKITFSGKRNIIFPDSTRKIIFQHNFFGKTIFSGRLENADMVFRAVIVPVHKLDDPIDKKNYMLVSVIPLLSKVRTAL